MAGTKFSGAPCDIRQLQAFRSISDGKALRRSQRQPHSREVRRARPPGTRSGRHNRWLCLSLAGKVGATPRAIFDNRAIIEYACQADRNSDSVGGVRRAERGFSGADLRSSRRRKRPAPRHPTVVRTSPREPCLKASQNADSPRARRPFSDEPAEGSAPQTVLSCPLWKEALLARSDNRETAIPTRDSTPSGGAANQDLTTFLPGRKPFLPSCRSFPWHPHSKCEIPCPEGCLDQAIVLVLASRRHPPSDPSPHGSKHACRGAPPARSPGPPHAGGTVATCLALGSLLRWRPFRALA